MKQRNNYGILGWILVIACGIGGAIGSALLTVDTSNKVLGNYIDETEKELARLEAEEGDDEDEEDSEE